MAEDIAGLGFSLDSSPLRDAAASMAGLSSAAQGYARALDQLAAAGEPMNRVLDDLERKLRSSGPAAAENARVLDELRRRYDDLAQAADKAAASAAKAGTAGASSYAGAQFPGGPPPSLPGMAGFAGAATGFQAQAGGASEIAPQAIQAGSAWRTYAQQAELAAAANQQVTQSAAAAAAAVANTGRAAQQTGAQVQGAATAAGGFRAALAALVGGGGGGGGAAGAAGAFAGGFGGPLAYITGGLAVQGINETAEALGRLTSSVVENGEAWLLAEQRIQFSLKTTQAQAAEVRQQLLDQSKGVSFESSVNTFQRIAPPLQEQGLDVRSIEEVTKALQEMAIVSGTAPARASRAIYEISEAFSTGKLSGQQFRTAILDMPAILQALAEATGKTQAQIIEMGHAGELTGGLIADSLLRYAPQLQQQFESVGNTVSRAAQDIGNAWTEVSGKVSEQTGLIGNLAGAYEAFADFLRSGAFMGTLGAIAQLFSDIGKGVVDSERQIGSFKAALANIPRIFDPNAGAAADPTQATAAQLASLQQQRGAAAAQAAAIARPGSGGFALPILGDRAAAADRKVAELDHEIADLRAQLEKQVGQALFPVTKNAQGGPLGIVNPGGEGDAASLAAKPVPSSLADTTQKLIEQRKTLGDLQEHLNQLRRDEEGLVKDQPGYEEKIAAIREDQATTAAKITTERQKERVEQYARARDIPEEQARQELAGVQNVNKALDERQRILAQIKADQSIQSFARSTGDTDLFHRAGADLAGQQQRLAELAQRQAESLERGRDSLLGQAGAAARLAADMDRIAAAQKVQPGYAKPELQTPDQVALAQKGAYERFYKGVEEEATRASAGASQRERVETQIAAVQAAQAAHTRDQGVGAAELLRLKTELARVEQTEGAGIEKAVDADQKRLDAIRAANTRAQQGGGDLARRVEDAGTSAAEQFPDLSPEQQKADPGAQVRVEAMREEAQTTAEANERLKERREAIAALGDPTLQLGEKQARLNEEFAAGLISLDQYNLALRRAQVQAHQQAVQQRIGDLYDTGEPGSGVGTGGQVASGAQAAGLSYIQQYGNAARDTGQFLTQMADQGIDAFTSLSTGAQVNLAQIGLSLAQLGEKMLLQIALARLLQAALGGSVPGANPGVPVPGGGGAGSYDLAGGGTDVAGAGVYHGGGEVGAGGGAIRYVPREAVRRAPRYHAGTGDVGADERLAVLQTGERVLDRREARTYNQGVSVNMGVVVNNNAGAQVSTRQDTAPDGSSRLIVQLEKANNGLVAAGRMDKAMSGRFGVGRALV